MDTFDRANLINRISFRFAERILERAEAELGSRALNEELLEKYVENEIEYIFEKIDWEEDGEYDGN